MTLSMYQASVPVFLRTLAALSGVLEKAAAHAAQKIGLHLGCILPGRQRASQIGLGQTKRVGQSEQ